MRGKKMDIEKKLTPRLRAVASLVPQCDSAADIGTDHAYLPIYLVKSGRVRRAVAADVKKGPLEAAKKNIALYHLEGSIETVLSDGLSSIDAADTVIISGMGGELIAKILEGRKDGMNSFVLQPQRSFQELRYFLAHEGYEIKKEAIAEEGRRMYSAFYAEYTGERYEIDRREALLGKQSLVESDPLFEKYREYRKRIVSDALSAMAGADDEARRRELTELIEIYGG